MVLLEQLSVTRWEAEAGKCELRPLGLQSSEQLGLLSRNPISKNKSEEKKKNPT